MQQLQFFIRRIIQKNYAYGFIFFLIPSTIYAQFNYQDSIDYDYAKINTYSLDGNVHAALTLLDTDLTKPLTQKAKALKEKYQIRFQNNRGIDDFLYRKTSPLNELLRIYANYWKAALLQPTVNLDTLLTTSLSQYLALQFSSTKIPPDSLDDYLKAYIEQKGYKTTGFSRTGKLLDLLIWKDQYDTTYNFTLKREVITAKVVFMENFVTLGWEEFATFGKSFPGGWATNEALYCVKTAYNLQSESFLVSYLAHEGKHYSDKKHFASLSDTTLEYRAKLIELAMAKETIPKILRNFIINSNSNSANAHSLANYSVIRDLSRALFRKEFEPDEKKWALINVDRLNKQAYKLYKANTRKLKQFSN